MVVGGCRCFQVFSGVFRSFHVLVLTLSGIFRKKVESLRIEGVTHKNPRSQLKDLSLLA